MRGCACAELLQFADGVRSPQRPGTANRLRRAGLDAAGFPPADTDGGTAAPLPLHPVIGTFEADETVLDECDEQACFEQAVRIAESVR